MNTIIANSSSRGYQYQVLDEIFRDACSDPLTWETIPKEGSGDLFCRCLKNKETGEVITCQGNADKSHTFTFTGA